MKKILITGSEGFIGSHLVERLIAKGYKVRCLILYNSFNNIGNLAFIKKPLLNKAELIFGDIRDNNLVTEISKNCSTIINLAALIGIPYSYKAVRSYLDVNILGTHNLLEAALKNRVKKFIHTSTSEIYGSAQFRPMTENHPYVAQSPYAASKISADALVTSFNKSFNLNTLILRPFNTFGPRQSSRAVIPTIIQQAINGNKINLGNTEPKRDFTYVDDTTAAYELSLKSNLHFKGEILNLGTGYSYSVLQIIKYVSKILDKRLEIVSKKERFRPLKSEVDNLISSNLKARKTLNWKPELVGLNGFKKGIIKTISFFKTYSKEIKRYNRYIY